MGFAARAKIYIAAAIGQAKGAANFLPAMRRRIGKEMENIGGEENGGDLSGDPSAPPPVVDEITKADIMDAAKSVLLSRSAVAEMLGISKSFVTKLVSAGRFPRAIKLGRRRLWSYGEILAWTKVGCPSRAEWEKGTGREFKQGGN